MPEVRIDVFANTHGAPAQLQQTEAALAGVAQQGKQTDSALGGTWKQMAAGVLAAGLVEKGTRALVEAFKDSIKQAAEYERAAKGLDAAFTITGRTMPGMAENLKKYASELEKLGLAEDDEILTSESLLLQMTSLNEDGIKAAERGALGLASVFGMDLKSATESVAKGMEGNYLMLNRLIPAVRNATTEEGKRAAMMKAFEDLFKRAIADTETYAGQVKKLTLEWKNAQQELGGAILQTGILQDSMEGLAHIIKVVSGAKGREDRAATEEMIAANNKASASIDKMVERLGLSAHWAALTRQQYNLSSEQLKDWILAKMLGTKEAETLNAVLKEEAAALADSKKGFTETGDAVIKTAAYFQTMSDRVSELTDDLRLLRSLGGSFNILSPVNNKTGSLGDMIGGDMAALVNYQEQAASGLFEFLGKTKDESKKTTDAVTSYFEGLWNDIASGFGNVFANFRLTSEGFADFFVGLWEQIKKEFFRIIGEMVARWTFFQALTGLAGIIGGPIGGFLGKTAASLKFWQEGFEGVVSKPTMAVFGEAGPEYVSVTPVNRARQESSFFSPGPTMAISPAFAGSGASVTLNFNAPLIMNSGDLSDSTLMQARDRLLDAVNKGLRDIGHRTI